MNNDEQIEEYEIYFWSIIKKQTSLDKCRRV